MVKRSKLGIYFDILQIIDSGVDKPTHIMYKSNMSWNPLKETLRTLTNGGFVREDESKNRRYYITQKGKNALACHLRAVNGLVLDTN